MKMYRSKSFVFAFLFGSIGILVIIGTFNAFIDPLWFFSHQNGYNRFQKSINERLQKTHRLMYGSVQYDALLLGSSRSTYISQEEFRTIRVFNYAAVDMMPMEYHHWIETAKKMQGKEFDYILIGLDFFGTNAAMDDTLESKPNERRPENIYARIKTPLYLFKNLTSLDTLLYSIENIRRSAANNVEIYYDRNNVKHRRVVSLARRNANVRQGVARYSTRAYGDDYRYRGDLKRLLTQLKKENPNSRFIVFTTPVSKPLFELLVKKKKLPYYQRWLREIVSVYGSVYHFMDINSVTSDPDNFGDAHHFYPSVGKMIVGRIMHDEKIAVPEDFGVCLTPKNVESYLGNDEDK